MRRMTTFRKILIVFASSIIAVIGVAYAKILLKIPDELILVEGENYVYNLSSLFPLSIKVDNDGVLEINGSYAEKDKSIEAIRPVSLFPSRNGNVNLDLKFFGLLPVKTVNVTIVEGKNVIACGNTVGVKLKLDGILVVGVSDVKSGNMKYTPVKNTGIKAGSVITEVDGKAPDGIDGLIKAIDASNGKTMKIDFITDNEKNTAYITPILSSEDKKYHIGLWVRDSTAGIGTLTYYDNSDNVFGALGHGITDIDTGALMSVESGEIMESSIVGIKAGRSGDPGELKGVFTGNTKLGDIKINSSIGIYGTLNEEAKKKLYGREYPVGVRADIKEGPATILSNINGKNIEEFEIMIQKISRQNLNGSKGMILKITDERLLKATGGIVQGMSGSPIIQNGKLIGAVTHVFVNDPTRGYGISLENMLQAASRLSNKKAS